MEVFLNKFAIRDRIVLIISVIVIVLSGFIWVQINSVQQRSQELERVSGLTRLTPAISNVIHELQRERGSSAGYIGSKADKVFATILSKQKKNTNGMLEVLGKSYEGFDWKAYSGELKSRVKKADDALAELESMREKVSSQEATVPQMAGYYTSTIAKLLDITKQIAGLTTEASLLRDITGFIAVLEMKERAGQERAFGSIGYANKSFPKKIFQKFVSLIAAQDVFMGQFKAYSSEEAVTFYNNTVTGTEVENINKWRAVALKTPDNLQASDVSGSDWYNTITVKIDLMKVVEDKLIGDIDAKSSGLAAEASANFIFIALLSAIMLVVTVIASFMIVRSIVSPLKGIQGSVTELASGNVEVDVPHTGYGSEIGALATAVQVFKENAIEKLRLEEEEVRAAEDRKQREEADRKREEAEAQADRERIATESAARQARQDRVDGLTSGFGNSVEEILSVVAASSTEMESSAKSMTEIAQQTQEQSVTVASAAEQATVSVQTVASAAEELSSSISEISRQVAHSSKISEQAVTAAESTNGTIRALADAAQKIGDVVDLINDIASQTNLLALNATIEAARAGDAGKGFAVVASEVKNLASQTAKATEDISAQIGSIQGRTQEAVGAVEDIRKTISEMNEIATTIASAVEEQGAATGEISRNVQQAAQGTQNVSDSIVNVKTGSEQTGEASGNVLEASQELATRFDGLRKEVEEFLTNIKAA